MASFEHHGQKLFSLRFKLTRLCFFVGLLSTLFLHSQNKVPPLQEIAILTIPKAGTNLIGKALFLISQTAPVLASTVRMGNNMVFFDHLWPGNEVLRTSSSLRKIIFIRDPRDVIVSMMYWIDRVDDWGGGLLSRSELEEFHALSRDDKLSYLILFPPKALGVPYFVETASRWMDTPGVATIRFEDLIGDQGGGNKNSQIVVIRSLAHLIGYNLTKQQVALIGDDLFGDSFTFRQGAIGSWRNEFTEAHKQLFKEKMGHALIEWGYEKDNNW